MAVSDRQIEPDIIADRHSSHGKTALHHLLLETRPMLSAGGQDGHRLAAKSMDHAGGIDAATAGRILVRKDVSAVVEREPVNVDGPVHRRIHGKGYDHFR